MAQDRQWVVDTLRRLGYVQEAEEAARILPDPVEVDQLIQFGDKYGISRDELMDRMGGSPLRAVLPGFWKNRLGCAGAADGRLS